MTNCLHATCMLLNRVCSSHPLWSIPEPLRNTKTAAPSLFPTAAGAGSITPFQAGVTRKGSAPRFLPGGCGNRAWCRGWTRRALGCLQAHRDGGGSQIFERVGSPRAKAETGQVLWQAERGVALPAAAGIAVVPDMPSWGNPPSWLLSHGAELFRDSRLQGKGWKSLDFGLSSSLSGFLTIPPSSRDAGGVVPPFEPAALFQMNLLLMRCST